MASEAERILRTLDKHLTGPGEIRLLGGAALVLGYETFAASRTRLEAMLQQETRDC